MSKMTEQGTRRGALFLHSNDIQTALKSPKPSSIALNRTLGTIGSDASVGSNDGIRSASATQGNSRSNAVESFHPSNRKKKRAGPSQRRPSTLPDIPLTPQRYSSIRRHSVAATPLSQRRQSTMKHPTPEKHPEPALTYEQVEAFQEVFDLFDRNGGGTIDADELDQALQSVDIHISKEEIYEIFQTIDKDGSGEIDFEEFLTLMTNTEKFLEIFAARHENGESSSVEGRETVLFDALTQFMKKSALKQMDEIVGYYNTKYKRAQAPHVVMHYAAGARLIGLTEKQLAAHLKQLQASNKDHRTNPYAQPLYNIFFQPRKKKKSPKTNLSTLKALEKSETPGGIRCTGKIRLKIRLPDCSDSENDNKPNKIYHKQQKPLGSGDESKSIVFRPKLGWSTSHVKSITAKLPSNLKDLTTNDIPIIRETIRNANIQYLKERNATKRRENKHYWRHLGTQHIPSKTLQNNFQKSFRAYIAAGL